MEISNIQHDKIEESQNQKPVVENGQHKSMKWSGYNSKEWAHGELQRECHILEAFRYGSGQYTLLGVADPELPDFLVFQKKSEIYRQLIEKLNTKQAKHYVCYKF